jgi:hypothetical protein
VSGPWYPLDGDFRETDGSAEAEAAGHLLRSIQENGMGAGIITITGFDYAYEMLVTMSVTEWESGYVLVVSRRDGSLDWFTTRPPDGD